MMSWIFFFMAAASPSPLGHSKRVTHMPRNSGVAAAAPDDAAAEGLEEPERPAALELVVWAWAQVMAPSTHKQHTMRKRVRDFIRLPW